ncbi:dynein axonemal intermediate chain 7-like [Liolophura sinensis]|uniref:dynein axonemal intermediate chain 7-like n=1 Tax=Liolophura sinensis TaxID=3198878 RepID=UPI0031588A69
MPPKPGSGKKKLSKAEKEKLKKEEAERKAQEEEEARLLEEQEEKKRKKKEKALEVERKKLEIEERKHRKVQIEELNDVLDNHRKALEGDNEFRRKEAKWKRYLMTDGSPDPSNQGEINTYINLKRENNTSSDIETVLLDSHLDLALIDELEFLLHDTPKEELTDAVVDHYKTTIQELQDLLKFKLDAASHEILLRATELQDPETLNLQFTTKSDQISLCIWGNLCKNPRIKSYEFTDTGFMFEIPKQLTLAECAFRVLSTKYDHYSMYCKTYTPRLRKKKEEPVEEVCENEEERGEKEAEDEGEKTEGEEAKPEGAELEKEDTMDLMASLREANNEEEAEEETGSQDGKGEEPKEEEEEPWEDPVTPEPPEWEDFDGDDDEVDLRAYHVIGGVFHFNLLHLPPQPKTVNNWTMTQLVNPPVLEYMDYVADFSSPIAPSPGKDQKEPKDNQEEKKKEEKPPIGVSMRLPEDVLFMEEPQVARWDNINMCWKLDGFTDIKYFEEERKLKFKTNRFDTMALLQDFHINMPFQSWEIRPHSANSAVFTIIAAIVELEIEIKDSLCCLSKPGDKPELSHLLNKWMTPRDFITALQKAGVNVFPAEDSSKYVSIQEKSPIVEDRLYEQMALTSAAMSYSWSKWNSECANRDWILFQGAEALEDEPLLEEDWSLFLITKRRAMKLKMTEYDETFSDQLAEDTEFQSNLYHLLMNIGSEKAQQRIDNVSYQFVHCVHQLLSATKFLTYA